MFSSPHRTARKVVASIALTAAATAAVAPSAFGLLVGSRTVARPVDAGKVPARLDASGGRDHRLTLSAAGMAPGDTIQQLLTLRNTGQATWGAATITTSATTSSALDTNLVDGLQLRIDRCSTPWTGAAASPHPRYACAGNRTPVLASGPIIRENATLGPLTSLAPGAEDNLRASLTLPRTAGNSFQGVSSTIDVTFTGTQ